MWASVLQTLCKGIWIETVYAFGKRRTLKIKLFFIEQQIGKWKTLVLFNMKLEQAISVAQTLDIPLTELRQVLGSPPRVIGHDEVTNVLIAGGHVLFWSHHAFLLGHPEHLVTVNRGWDRPTVSGSPALVTLILHTLYSCYSHFCGTLLHNSSHVSWVQISDDALLFSPPRVFFVLILLCFFIICWVLLCMFICIEHYLAPISFLVLSRCSS